MSFPANRFVVPVFLVSDTLYYLEKYQLKHHHRGCGEDFHELVEGHTVVLEAEVVESNKSTESYRDRQHLESWGMCWRKILMFGSILPAKHANFSKINGDCIFGVLAGTRLEEQQRWHRPQTRVFLMMYRLEISVVPLVSCCYDECCYIYKDTIWTTQYIQQWTRSATIPARASVIHPVYEEHKSCLDLLERLYFVNTDRAARPHAERGGNEVKSR